MTTRDVETDEDFAQLGALPGVAAIKHARGVAERAAFAGAMVEAQSAWASILAAAETATPPPQSVALPARAH